MDWLKDKKNQPYVAIGAAVIIVIVGVVMFMTMRGGASSDSAEAPPNPDMSMPAGGSPGMPPMPGMPSGPGASGAPGTPAAPAGPAAAPSGPATAADAKAGQLVAKVQPMLESRKDPFLPIGYKPPPRKKKELPPITDFPFIMLPHPGRDADARKAEPEEPQPARRMAGLLLNGRIFAIIETNGKSEVRQPGDMLDDRLAMVEKIERDKVILKTTTGSKPRRLVIRMAAAPRTDAGDANVSPDAGVGRPPMGPGMMSPMPGMMPGMPGARRPM